jgi:hypothetical protein
MKARDLVKELIEGDLDAEVLVLVPGSPNNGLEGWSTTFRSRGVVVLGTGTYGTDSSLFRIRMRAHRRLRPPRKA